MSGVAITEKLLAEAGGWQAMEHARALLEMGRVISSNYTPPILKGLVREGDTEFRAGLKILSPTNVENLCSCRPSREWGTICAHSLAVGLRSIRPVGPSVGKGPAGQGRGDLASRPPSSPERGPRFHPESGEPGQLHVILPPNFPQAWEKGRIMVGAELQTRSRRALLDALNADATFRCSEKDAAVVALLREMNGGAVSGMNILDREQFVGVLGALREHPRVSFGRSATASILREPVRPSLSIETDPQTQETVLRAQIPSEALPMPGKDAFWILENATFREVAPGLPAAYHPLLLRSEIRLGETEAAKFLAGELRTLEGFFDISVKDGRGRTRKVETRPGIPGVSLEVEGSLNRLTARLQFLYGSRVITSGIATPDEQIAYKDSSHPDVVFTRNRGYEDSALERLTNRGFANPDVSGHYMLKGEQPILSFFSKALPQLQQQWNVTIGTRFSNVTRDVERLVPKVAIRASGENWFDLDVSLVGSGGLRFSAGEIRRLLQSGQSHVRLANRRLAVFNPDDLESIQEVLRDCEPEQTRPGSYRVHRIHAGYLDAATTDSSSIEIDTPPQWTSWTRSSRSQAEMEPVPLGDLEGTLRPYQKLGVAWMSFLAANGLGGILADEMGLGKTLQTLAFARHLRETRPDPAPALIVCPSSLVYNWAREAARFTPSLSVLVVQGANRRELFPRIPSCDLVITSYPLLRRDSSHYRGTRFGLAVLDEAQHIKNPDTQNAKAAGTVRADTRFVLTGTPVENSVRDLWSIMNFALPGYLGGQDDFRDRYEIPITRHRAADVQKRLNQRLRPFMLRRLKRDVVKDLPEKIEQVAYCELTPAQAAAYREILEQGRRKIDEASSERNAGRARMMVLTTLLRLRQACCDLRLLGIEETAPGTAASAKTELLGELLEEAIDGGHRVLVFSQFVGMLQLLRENLESSGTAFSYLDGSTKDRSVVVDEFQSNPEIPVFLISLKAGGVGLNLTGADTVVHFDPWWNPAVEAQATDRAHRIGQESVVTAYKLIARGTVEEKILDLQKRKRDVIDATVESETPLMDGLSMDEISSLLE